MEKKTKFNTIVNKLIERPCYLANGAGFLAKKFNVDKDTIYDAKRQARDLIERKEYNSEFKRLFFDIETSYNIGKFWSVGYKKNITPSDVIKERAVICISYKWENEDKIHNLRWDENQCDKEILKEFSKIMESADEVIGHNCVTETTKVLKEDLTWVEAGELKVGDELVGFEEGNVNKCRIDDKWIGNSGKYRKFEKSIITGYEKKLAPVYRITFDDNSYVDTTEDHKWLGMAPKDQNHRWFKTSYLKPGYRCIKPFDVWETEEDYNSGYLSGIIDADGSISKDGYYNTAIYQSDKINNDICKKINNVLEDKNIEYSEDYIETSKIISTSYKGAEKIKYPTEGVSHVFRILGSIYDKLKYIGKYRIQKELRIFSSDNLGYVRVPSSKIRTVINKEYIGEKTIVVMQTSSKTFIANGYLMHNCNRFDIPWLRTRCLYHRISFPTYVKSLDTYSKSKSMFNFQSNKLDYIAKFLNVGGKISTGGLELWDNIILHKDEEAMQKMIEYCNNDVLILEDVFKVIINYIKPNTHIGVYEGGNLWCCPNCGSDKVNYIKPTVTAKGVVQRVMKCTKDKSDFVISNTTYKKYLENGNQE